MPTSPLRTAAHVTAVARRLVEEGWDAVWSVSRADRKYHPLKALTLGDDGRLDLFDARGVAVVARQQLAPTFYRNGAAYAFTRAALVERRSILPPRSSAVVIEEPMVSIDTPDDLERAEALWRARAAGPAPRP